MDARRDLFFFCICSTTFDRVEKRQARKSECKIERVEKGAQQAWSEYISTKRYVCTVYSVHS